ncbi:MAG: TetR/AcrR family transcriptional regulator [Arachnia sp.]
MTQQLAPPWRASLAPRPRGSYRKSEHTKARIIRAATEVFAANGFDKGSLRQVAEAAGISQAGLLHHYPNKVALLTGVLRARDLHGKQAVSDTGHGVSRLVALVDFARRSVIEHPEEIEIFAIMSAEATRPEHLAHGYFVERYLLVAGIIEQALRQARHDGHLRHGLCPALATSQLIGLWDGLQVQWLLLGRQVDIAAQLELLTNSFLVAPLRELARPQAT